MKFNTVDIMGIPVGNISLQETADLIEEAFTNGELGQLVVTANPEIIMVAQEDQEFNRLLQEAKIVTPDGIGLILAGKILGTPIKERVTGIDLTTELLKRAARKGYRVFFLGAKPGVAQEAKENLERIHPELKIVGVQHGYFKEIEPVLEEIRAAKPHLILVALGMARQEKWFNTYGKELGIPVGIGVGGSFDVLSGRIERAPAWMQKIGLEWLYRLYKEPSRFWRMLVLPKFLLVILGRKLTGQAKKQ